MRRTRGAGKSDAGPCVASRAVGARFAIMITHAPTRASVEDLLGGVRARILELGVRRLALFGSVRRDAAGPESDVDFLVEFSPGNKTFDHLVGLGDLLEGLLGRRVELVTPESLSPILKPHILADAVDVFRAA